ncbi:hypothetical protein HYN48_02095 [Flavobacterium magnum]|uniref:Secretion system C-terminal sorting domain-containing protein n=1 Tax=Flavobacterium magnum TaxID=2162713 RepID=A0A2S0RBB6_9FLAO|nr:T9SS type A sorting domain-containing protein [Flavobacterium magnum]AWA28973.1 hypothetical protein HYN48_02095 [Flavobacterium magnum]
MKKHYTSILLLFACAVFSFNGMFARGKAVSASLELVLTGLYLDSNQDGILNPGDNIAYTFTISNNGDESINSLLLNNELLGMNDLNIGSLAAGQTTSFNSNLILTQAHIDMGMVVTTAVIYGTTASGNGIQDLSDNGDPTDGSDDATVILLEQQVSQLRLLKFGSVNGNGGLGDTITYTFYVTNTGNTPVSQVGIMDALTGSVGLPVFPYTLSPGQTGTAMADHEITQADLDAGMVVNSASVVGFSPGGLQVTDVSDDGDSENGDDDPTITLLSQSAEMSLITEVSFIDSNNNGIAEAGETLVINEFIINNGSVTLHDILVTLFSGNNSQVALAGPGLLLPGQSGSITTAYVLTQQDIDNGAIDFTSAAEGYGIQGEPIVSTSYITTFVFAQSNTIRLNAFLDSNANSIQDEGESGFSLGQFRYVKNDSGVSQYLYPYSGAAVIYGLPEDSYDVYFEIDPQYAGLYTLATASFENITPGTEAVTYNFPLTTAGAIYDLSVSLQQFGLPPRPGFTYDNLVVFTNNGNQTITSGTISFNTEDIATVVAVSDVSADVFPAGFNYTFINLLPLETRYLSVTMQVPPIPSVELGQVLTNSVNAAIAENDVLPGNNSDFVMQTVVGSYDPNDKTEKHAGKIVFSDFSADDYLTYTIRFENTGTANAENVIITDTLDAMLDEGSVKMVSASAPYVLERSQNELTWHFNDIDLPPSDGDGMLGHGYVTFKVKPKAGFALGDIIPNTASIYFDFNPAIVTNTCQTEFVSQLGLDDPATMDFVVYPNPANDNIGITMNGNHSITGLSVLDVAGKIILDDDQPQAHHAVLNLSGLASGMYLLRIYTDQGTETTKFIKK